MTAAQDAIAAAQVAARAAEDKLANDVVIIDVSERLAITDCFVLASAPNERHVNAVVDAVDEALRLAGHRVVRREGERSGRWALLDAIDVVVHVQHREEREFYSLDRLWKDCPKIAFVSQEAKVAEQADEARSDAADRVQGAEEV
jgi:ribosome-associated protein